MEKAAEEQPAPLEVPQCDSGCPPRRAFVPCLSQSKRLQAAQQDPLEERAQIYAWCASARRSAPNPRAPSPRYPLEVGPWLLLSLDFHQGLRLLASPTQQGALVPLSPGAGWGSLEASQSARPARLARPHGGFTGALGLVLVSPTLSPLDPECGVAFPSSNPHGGASAHQSPALSRRSGTRSLATCTRGWPSWSLRGLA